MTPDLKALARAAVEARKQADASHAAEIEYGMYPDSSGEDLEQAMTDFRLAATPKAILQYRNEVLEEAAAAVKSATLPENFQWGYAEMEQFNFGKERSTEAIRSLKTPEQT